ncbi:MAG TPA: F0F1 ATP synthase subunit C [Myxococcales bacterium]|mgnify:CR=1 FL=1|nr:F0F1 ATP synthase subunit C [Myxococcales bacterium]HAN32737.1 F0F1 ATP synthase subunit C [Myxococcales bacterium]
MNLKKMTSALFAFVSTLVLFALPAFAEGAAGAEPNSNAGYIALAMGLGLGIAAAGGGMGQGKAAAAALEGIGRNPGAADKIFTPLLLSLALIESLVIYSLVISFMLLGKI